ncbi:MAG: DUF4955 domain-containing protein [Rikenellaceae bacterium]
MKKKFIYTFLMLSSLLFSCQEDVEGTLDPGDSDGYTFEVDCTDQQTFYLGESFSFDITSVGVEEVTYAAPDNWSVEISESSILITAPSQADENSEEVITLTVKFENSSTKSYQIEVALDIEFAVGVSPTWVNFVRGNEDNILVDFSYAGYMHGEASLPDVYSLGYEIFNIEDYGGDGTDEISDRDAFTAAYQAIKTAGKGILYIPEGRFIIHDETDNLYSNTQSRALGLNMSNLIIKGAGQDKSFIVMQTPNLPSDESSVDSSPVMISISHDKEYQELTRVTGSAKKGTFSLKVESASGISAGDWVMLYVANNNPEFVNEELSPYTLSDISSNNTHIGGDTGVEVQDYHYVTSVDGNVLTFKEPIMRAVDAKWEWVIKSFPNYENVGVEDLTFEGFSKENFSHNATWEDNGAYKLINFTCLTNSWMRNLTFSSVSEGPSLIECANISVHNVKFIGNRGHSAIRAQRSSRVFMGASTDLSDGTLTDGGAYCEQTGQYHSFGASKPSMGTVLWRNEWGLDGSFEAHASQPRATLVDDCTGGLFISRMGGSETQLPNHMGDLTIWNLNVTRANNQSDFYWWQTRSTWWQVMPPIIVGQHGESMKFRDSQVVINESNGTKVYPESLYEAQLELRLGYLPQWVTDLKNNL